MQSLCFPLTPYSNSRIALFVIATLLNEKQKRHIKVNHQRQFFTKLIPLKVYLQTENLNQYK